MVRRRIWLSAVMVGLVGWLGNTVAMAAKTPVAQKPVTLTVYAAGTLAVPFRQIAAAFEKTYPDVTVHAQFGGSVMMTKRVSALHQAADVVAVADYSVIPKYLFGGAGKKPLADWYIGFARNAITFAYTGKSKYAAKITPDTWYRYLSRPGVEIGRSNPDTDPSGYQTVQMLQLAQTHYGVPGLAAKVLANAPLANMRDTETSLISALQIGQIDYLAIYRSDALQHHLKFIDLPAAINLSDAADADAYAKAVAHTKNGDVHGKPIVYAVTVPKSAEHAAWGARFVAFVIGKEGRKIMAQNGFGPIAPAFAVHGDKLPASLHKLVAPWPGS